MPGSSDSRRSGHGFRPAPYAGGPREGDSVVVWQLDRLSRSLNDVLHIVERIAQVGPGFASTTENIDTTIPAGRMMMQMIGGGSHQRSTQEARHRQTARDRAPLQHQPAHRVTDCRPASDGSHKIRTIRKSGRGARDANLEEAALENSPENLELHDKDVGHGSSDPPEDAVLAICRIWPDFGLPFAEIGGFLPGRAVDDFGRNRSRRSRGSTACSGRWSVRADIVRRTAPRGL